MERKRKHKSTEWEHVINDDGMEWGKTINEMFPDAETTIDNTECIEGLSKEQAVDDISK